MDDDELPDATAIDASIAKSFAFPKEGGQCPVCGLIVDDSGDDSLEIHVILEHFKAGKDEHGNPAKYNYPILPVCWCGKRFWSSAQCFDHLREEDVWSHFALCGLGVEG